MPARTFVTRIGATLALVSLAATGQRVVAQDFLSKSVREFFFHGKRRTGARAHVPVHASGGIHEALRALASHAEVPLCIESVSIREDQPIVPIEVKTKHPATVEEILRQMVAQDPRYEYRQRLGVIEVLPVGADKDPADCLNMVIPEFEVNQSWKYVAMSLRCEVEILARDPHEVVPDPMRAGRCGGSFPGLGHSPTQVIEATFIRRKLRDILGELCARAGNMAWDAYFENPIPRCDYNSFGFYQPRQWYPSDTEPLTWSEGLPKKCVSCHYHRPCLTDRAR